MRTKLGASVLAGLAACATACLLLAGPASADATSTGPNAMNNSTSSGQGTAINGSDASGNAVAMNGSTGSGCASASDTSTASGGGCAPVATPVPATNLAFTGFPTAALAAIATALLGIGVVMVTTSRRVARA